MGLAIIDATSIENFLTIALGGLRGAYNSKPIFLRKHAAQELINAVDYARISLGHNENFADLDLLLYHVPWICPYVLSHSDAALQFSQLHRSDMLIRLNYAGMFQLMSLCSYGPDSRCRRCSQIRQCRENIKSAKLGDCCLGHVANDVLHITATTGAGYVERLEFSRKENPALVLESIIKAKRQHLRAITRQRIS